MTTRKQIVKEARTWLETPWNHQQNEKGNQVDCVNFLYSVATSCGVNCGNMPLEYERLSNGILLIEYLDEYFEEKPLDKLLEGDILVFKFWDKPHHVGLCVNILGEKGLIHASEEYGKVTEHILDKIWIDRIAKIYDIGCT